MNTMTTFTKMGLAIVGSGALIFGAPLMANAATAETQPRINAQASQEPQGNNAELTFVSGTADRLELTVIDGGNRTVAGVSGSATSFTQDDGWNQETQQWTGGNELVIGFDDLQFTIGDLSFANGQARGHVVGEGLPNAGMDLADANAQVQVDGRDVTITAKEGRGCGEWILKFTLASDL